MLGERRVKKEPLLKTYCACVIATWRLAWDQVPQLEKKAKKIGERSEPSCSPPQCTSRLVSLAEYFFLLFAVLLHFLPYFFRGGAWSQDILWSPAEKRVVS